MKKKSLLILPVLLLALAACNKEDDEVIEDDTPEITDTTSDDDGGTTEDEKEDEKKEEQIDARIILATESVDFGANAGFVNPNTLSIAETTVDDDGNVTYVLGGAPSTMDETQAAVFWSGVAADGDAYIVITIEVRDGETVSWLASDGQEKSYTYAECEGVVNVVIRISGICLSNEIPMGRAVYTISNETAQTSVTHTVDFSSIVELPSRVTLASGPVYFDNSTVAFENSDSLYIASAKVGEDGNLTYYVKGTPNVMDEAQEGAFQVSGAAGSAYVVLTISLKTGESLSFGESKTADSTEDVIVRLVNYGTSVFTITDGESSSVTHTVDFSGVTHPDTTNVE